MTRIAFRPCQLSNWRRCGYARPWWYGDGGVPPPRVAVVCPHGSWGGVRLRLLPHRGGAPLTEGSTAQNLAEGCILCEHIRLKNLVGGGSVSSRHCGRVTSALPPASPRPLAAVRIYISSRTCSNIRNAESCSTPQSLIPSVFHGIRAVSHRVNGAGNGREWGRHTRCRGSMGPILSMLSKLIRYCGGAGSRDLNERLKRSFKGARL